MTERTIRLPRSAVTLIAAGGLAMTGAGALAAGWAATATPGDPHKVWVCKYVQTPHQNEVLKAGKNPIFVDWAALTGREDAPAVGDTFSDEHDKSVVVQIGGADPGVGACAVSTPPTTTTTTVPTTTTSVPTTTVPTTTTSVPTTTTSVPTTTVPTTTTSVPTTTTGGGGGGGGGTQPPVGPVPGVGAPDTGGGGDATPASPLIGTGLLAAGIALAAGEAVRRRREDAGR